MLRRGFAKRLLVGAHDACALFAMALLLTCGLPHVAFAYVDPSVMTYTIQALAGVAVALSAIAGVAFRRTRRALMKALNIDEDARKEHEPDVHRVADGAVVTGPDRDVGQVSSGAQDRPERTAAFEPKWWQRLVLAAIVSVFAVFTLGLVAPFELISGNASSLIFSLVLAWRPIAATAGVAACVLALGLSALRGRAFAVGVVVVFAFGLCCYVQAMFMNPDLPAGDGHQVDWGKYLGITVFSALVWIAVFAGLLVLQWKRRRATVVISSVVAVMLVIVQGVGVASLFTGIVASSGTTAEDYVMTEKGMFSVSPDRNAIVFVLDTYDTLDLMDALEQDPTLLDEFAGFTWFQDSVGSMDPTRYGAPFLQTGVYPQVGEDLTTFVEERYERSSYLADLYDAGYSIGIYTDTIGDYLMPEQERREMIYDKTENIMVPGGVGLALDSWGTVAVMWRCALYRDLPWTFKPAFWFTTDEVNKEMSAKDAGQNAAVPYAMDDAEWFRKLKEQRLSVDDELEGHGAYRFLHLLGTHVPYEIDENGNDVGYWNSDQVTQARGSMVMVAEYLRQLKDLGVYDDATIVVTADHGEWFDKDFRTDWDIPTSPVMLVKPAGAKLVPAETSAADVTAYDVLPTIIESVRGDASEYGATVFGQPESGRDRHYLHTITFANDDLEIVEYQIAGDVLDENSWVATGTTWDPSGVPR